MAIQTLSTSLKIDSPVYQLCSSYGIVYNQHIRCINISFYTHALILFNSAPPAAASAASAAASAASAAASAASAAAFQLELPRTMLIHNVFHLSLLWKAATDFPARTEADSIVTFHHEWIKRNERSTRSWIWDTLNAGSDFNLKGNGTIEIETWNGTMQMVENLRTARNSHRNIIDWIWQSQAHSTSDAGITLKKGRIMWWSYLGFSVSPMIKWALYL